MVHAGAAPTQAERREIHAIVTPTNSVPRLALVTVRPATPLSKHAASSDVEHNPCEPLGRVGHKKQCCLRHVVGRTKTPQWMLRRQSPLNIRRNLSRVLLGEDRFRRDAIHPYTEWSRLGRGNLCEQLDAGLR